jgi:hypothetical protein
MWTMRSISWVFDLSTDSRLLRSPDGLAEAAARQGDDVVVGNWDSGSGTFDRDLPQYDGRPIVSKGCIGFVSHCRDRAGFAPAGFGSADDFSWERTVAGLGDACLNASAAVMPFSDLEKALAGADGPMFVKPADGGKAFCGTVLQPGERLDDKHYRRHRWWNRPADGIRVVAGRAVERLEGEWRFLVSGGRVVDGSRYCLPDGSIRPDRVVPREAFEAAQAAVDGGWQPERCWMIDVALAGDSGFRVVEANPFGSSGLYALDPEAVAAAIREAAHAPKPAEARRLFLDDERMPVGSGWGLARSHEEAVSWVLRNGCPSFISFDNDLGPEAKEGWEFARWLVERDLDGDGRVIPDGFGFFVHSRNVAATERIRSLLDGYLDARSRRAADRGFQSEAVSRTSMT